MLMSLAVSVFFGKTKIDHIDDVGFVSEANQKVIRFNISVDVILAVDKLNSGDLGILVVSKSFLTIWSASIRTVFKLNFLLFKLKRSSRLGPNKEITMTWCCPSVPE